ncbi:hypothetical protein L1987_53651 [Smallanthus sonchifolius]|uniref:Uncharacterized protein n=1 Tax=Smallanthus sonchifolius TaxID=185202 RepID=A0ACB9EW75_9ASTR|nr:hypothetical protein L1987_53651 [Smallanthus sonchifolius]
MTRNQARTEHLAANSQHAKASNTRYNTSKAATRELTEVVFGVNVSGSSSNSIPPFANHPIQLAKRLKKNIQQVRNKEEARWELLVRKVLAAEAASSVSKRKLEDHEHEPRSFREALSCHVSVAC